MCTHISLKTTVYYIIMATQQYWNVFFRNECIETRPSVVFQIDSVCNNRAMIDFIVMLIIFLRVFGKHVFEQ